ncbi:HDOD domain-containing protein [Pseudomonas mediterranea]|uniref:HDOD domain-containing protein n=1 Tax=Pseudomonas mediterranea TaxID=183795 RepID=A0AAX2DKM8_9PSED|nr:HDOD domain-containing protein [Pseudomonas mediterranea]KGU85645.1 histidine kinase [Pseudomonas mediterranea CFBP 5447]MBL0842227.1 HDOD domain-containing protein [Pseudomonas mediterranea]MDU9026644.1 HDOD domain-containing protein [Pseudomonas mediterranea]QHA80649.1 HDOD domain-containing protein [Pseudomonas mediterranea]UZE01543.1 HDOD domain-containing protein [Pseudomonas mediterranea]
MANETKVPTPRPTTLEGWVKLLEGVHLPVPQASHDQVCKAVADSRRSLRDIAELMQDSPALALSVIREANHHTHGSLTEPAENLEVAINRLGLKRTEELLARLPSLPEQEIPVTLRQLQLISQHATQQANGFFAGRLARLWQDIHWGSLLFLSPLWPLALTHPRLLGEWEMRVMHRGQSASKVERELFGVGLLEICLAVVEAWRLPIWVAQGYRLLLNERRELVKVLRIARDSEHPLRQQNRLDDDPTLRRWLNQPANTVLLANGLALSAHQAWDCPHNIRWQYLTSLYLQMPMDELQQQLHQQAANSARHHAMPDLWHPAVALLWPPGSRRVQAAGPSAAQPSAADLALWRKRCAALLVEPSPFSNAMHLTTSARDALVACGMRRVMILMADRNQTSVRVHQTAGLSPEAAAMSFSIDQSKVLQRLLAQQAQVRLNPENNAQFSALLPPGLRALFKGEHMLLRSLTCNGRVIMLVAVDQGGGPFTDVTVQAFGRTVQCIERALHTFTNRGR